MYIPLLGPIDLPLNCRATILTHNWFLTHNICILNASVILERNEKCLERNEKRLERNETRLARNETRGGNLLLGGTVQYNHLQIDVIKNCKNNILQCIT